MVNLSNITKDGKALYLAYDQGMEHGTSDFDDENVDPNYILGIAIEGEYNAIIFQKGVAEKYYDPALKSKISLILKLNGKTNLVKGQDPYSPLLCTVSEALELGASAVGYTVYVGSAFESKMTSEFSQIVRDAHRENMPVIGWMYPRGRSVIDKDERELIAYAARMGLELGADIVKVKYPGSLEALKWVVESAGKTKVVVSGGVKEEEETFLGVVRTVMKAGAAGMAVGRNVWQSKDPIGMTEKLKEIIFK
ncbi:MAG: fructose-bisphosphate aldolase [Candidatus Levybacteria bacterium]|nr:fructose-bisphosphate aldolase [Candidatus Levybacteria bacterium]MBI3092717.1 fructose-bisphosphate aldolase [Candidatus Levybacteria bacterium]